jgi:GntR family transcriptional regulator
MSSADARVTLPPVDRTTVVSLHEQVAGSIRRAIADGEANPGDRLPQARDLAAVLGVNTNTVLRALRLLREEGLLEMGRGRRIVVAGSPQRSAVVSRLREMVTFARSQGYSTADLAEMLDHLE